MTNVSKNAQHIIQQIGTPKQIYEKPINIFVASFIGNPPMNLIKGKINDGQFISENINIKKFNNKNGNLRSMTKSKNRSFARTKTARKRRINR